MKAILERIQKIVEEERGTLMNGGKTVPFKILIGISVVGHLLSLISPSFFQLLTLSPSSLFGVQLWRLLTSPFVGHNLLVLSITVFSLQFGVRLLIQEYSTLHLLKTFFITQISCSIVLSILSYILYALFSSSYLLYDVSLCGMAPIIAAVIVMVKQFLPDSIVWDSGMGRIKYTHLPLNACLLSFIASLIGLVRFVVPLEIVVGTQLSWTYLRFLSPHETEAVIGDPSDHFAWATLFPSAFRPFCTLISKAVFRSLVKCGICKRKQIRHVDVTSLLSGGGPSSPAMRTLPMEGERKDSERRRQKALVELNKRLKQQKEEKIDWDEDEEEREETPEKVVSQSVSPSPIISSDPPVA
ncbi:hypothetical protein PFISCL1PPCAC_14865 [Pristionchus fissidentatus]|uniref:Transmembrane protein n=1 Tax=Pristionchus fissidentatus TaxID=1538716 RepID=A0AAV5VVW2_9BILA|nr:hypothetical protein PFISCL1PPCAC_14865 [Pristionchus fissidentatus]